MLHAVTAEPRDQGTAHFQPSTLQISTADVCNRATNVVPSVARAVFNIRFNDLHTGASLESWLRRKFDAAHDASAGGRYELSVKVSGEAFLTPPDRKSTRLNSSH